MKTRGRKPHLPEILPLDQRSLERITLNRTAPWYQVQHAWILLDVAAGKPIEEIAYRNRCDRTTVWRICRRYESDGLSRSILDEERLGHPRDISPSAASGGRQTRLSGTNRKGFAHYSLE